MPELSLVIWEGIGGRMTVSELRIFVDIGVHVTVSELSICLWDVLSGHLTLSELSIWNYGGNS